MVRRANRGLYRDGTRQRRKVSGKTKAAVVDKLRDLHTQPHRLHARLRAARFVHVSARMRRFGQIKPDRPNLFR